MSLFLKDLPSRNPDHFSKLHNNSAIRQTSVRPTYTAEIDSDAKEIINDPIPILIHRLSRLPKDEPCKRSLPEDESQVPSFPIDQTRRLKPPTIDINQPQSNLINCDDIIS